MNIIKWCALLLIPVFLLQIFTVLPCYAAARFAGTIISVDSGVYLVQLSDGSKKKIRLKNESSVQNSGRGGFSPGEYAVFLIVSPLNDDPLVAEGIMDSASAKKASPSAYRIPSNTNIGGFATSGGPSATGGTNPNVLASVANSGGNLNPPVVVNAPFTASPSAANSPAVGQVITGGSGSSRPLTAGSSLTGNSANGYNNMFTGQSSNAITSSPNNNPFAGQSITAGSSGSSGNSGTGMVPQMNPGSMITGQQDFQANPGNMIMDQSSKKNQDPFSGNMKNLTSPANMMIEAQDDDDENNVSMFADPSGNNGGNYAPCQINARVMDVQQANHVVFYMEIGTQNIGSVIVGPTTQIVNGQTRQPMNLQSLPKGSVVVITGYQMGNYIQAASIMMMQQR